MPITAWLCPAHQRLDSLIQVTCLVFVGMYIYLDHLSKQYNLTSLYIYRYTNKYVYIYIHTYVYIYTHICIYIDLRVPKSQVVNVGLDAVDCMNLYPLNAKKNVIRPCMPLRSKRATQIRARTTCSSRDKYLDSTYTALQLKVGPRVPESYENTCLWTHVDS